MNQNSVMNIEKTGIHCKVSFNGQFRRFLFNGTEFTSLQSQVKQILGLDGEFVLKYKDNEGDLITISSDEELVCALSFSDGSLLRLVAESGTNDMNVETPITNTFCPAEKWSCHGRWNRRGRHCQDKEKGLECRKSMMELKREWIKTRLDSIPKDTPLTPEILHRQKMLSMKLNRINTCIERLSDENKCNRERSRGDWKKNRETWKKCNNKDEWKLKKDDWKQKKKERKELKKVLKVNNENQVDENLSPAAKEEIALLKVQINSVKPEIKGIKEQICSRKKAIKEGNGDPSTLWKEIYDLKMKLVEKRSLVYPLKLRIREIRKNT
jgi:hypothetical protein